MRSTRVDLWLLHTIAPGKDAVRTRGQSLGFDALNDGLHRPSMLRYMKKSFIEDRPATVAHVCLAEEELERGLRAEKHGKQDGR